MVDSVLPCFFGYQLLFKDVEIKLQVILIPSPPINTITYDSLEHGFFKHFQETPSILDYGYQFSLPDVLFNPNNFIIKNR